MIAKKTITIKKGQHLMEVLPIIPSNTILNKTVTGCGATYCEIKADRNSIIIEPNRPVITGKCKDPKHKGDNLLGVVEGVNKDKIISYIQTSVNKKKRMKILTTPESFMKVKNAFEDYGLDIKADDFFVLFDECQKISGDVDYRSYITLPMNFFFACKNKAVVSATPPKVFEDKRFHDFTLIDIEPDYDYKRDIYLCTTNNVLQRLRELLPSLWEKGIPIFIFVNYTKMIYSLMEQLSIMNDSAVFCSGKSTEKLEIQKFSHYSKDWDIKKMKKINFMTSRFFSAVDIELDVRPIVILVTDVFAAQYTMFDPYMDTVQIIGRFRNGVSDVFHISNVDKRIPMKSLNEIKYRFQCDKDIYMQFKTFRDNNEKTLREAYQAALDVLPYNRYLDDYGNENPYLVDNYIIGELVKNYYCSYDSLQSAYMECGYFRTNVNTITYKIGDLKMLSITSNKQNIKDMKKRIINMLDILGDCQTEADREMQRVLYNQEPWLVKGYYKLGKDKVEEFGYSTTKIKEAIIIKEHNEKTRGNDLILLINNTFHQGSWYSCKHIKKELIQAFEKLNIPSKKRITATTIQEYFDACPERKNGQRGYRLIRNKFVAKM